MLKNFPSNLLNKEENYLEVNRKRSNSDDIQTERSLIQKVLNYYIINLNL